MQSGLSHVLHPPQSNTRPLTHDDYSDCDDDDESDDGGGLTQIDAQNPIHDILVIWDSGRTLRMG